MPYTPTTPESKPVPVATTKSLNVFHIHSFEVKRDPNDAAGATLQVEWSKGYTQDGTYFPVEFFMGKFGGSNLISSFTATVTNGNSRYKEIKDAIWALLESGCDVSNVTIS